jgi:hypothetical protein
MVNTNIAVMPGVEIKLSNPENIPSAVISALIPQVVKTAAEIITKSGSNIISATVEAYETTTAKIVFYQEQGRVLREEVIPVLAKAKAYQNGRDALRGMNLDADILQEFQDELDKRRRGR